MGKVLFVYLSKLSNGVAVFAIVFELPIFLTEVVVCNAAVVLQVEAALVQHEVSGQTERAIMQHIAGSLAIAVELAKALHPFDKSFVHIEARAFVEDIAKVGAEVIEVTFFGFIALYKVYLHASTYIFFGY